MAYDPFADPTMQPMAANNALAPVAVPAAPTGTGASTVSGGPVGGGQVFNRARLGGGGFGYGGFGFGGGMFGKALNGLQFPSDMTAQQLMTNLQGMDWRSLMQGYRGDLQDWRQGGMDGSRPTIWNEIGTALGGTYGSPAPAPAQGIPTGDGSGVPVMTPGGGGASPPVGTPGNPFPPTSVGMVPGVPGSMGTNPGAGRNGFGGFPTDWRSLAGSRFGRTGG